MAKGLGGCHHRAALCGGHAAGSAAARTAMPRRRSPQGRYPCRRPGRGGHGKGQPHASPMAGACGHRLSRERILGRMRRDAWPEKACRFLPSALSVPADRKNFLSPQVLSGGIFVSTARVLSVFLGISPENGDGLTRFSGGLHSCRVAGIKVVAQRIAYVTNCVSGRSLQGMPPLCFGLSHPVYPPVRPFQQAGL